MRWLGSWTFYLLGDLWWRAFGRWAFDDHGWRWRMFQVEQWLFATADRIQGETDHGPWRKPEPEPK